jgi:hypothetical protein
MTMLLIVAAKKRPIRGTISEAELRFRAKRRHQRVKKAISAVSVPMPT